GQQSPQVDICSSPSSCPVAPGSTILSVEPIMKAEEIFRYCTKDSAKSRNTLKSNLSHAPPSRVFPDLEVALKAGGTGRQGSNSLYPNSELPLKS
ncbi:hypothetical protein E2320_015550, partial [Naja naja]